MSAAPVFSIANAVALVAWLLLAALPRQRWVSMATSRVVPAAFAAAYVAIEALNWSSSAGSFSTLDGVAALFSSRWLLLAGWIHYLAFDLLVGHWEVHDARDRGIPHLVVVPCLLLTFLFGPAGWLAYAGVRFAWPRRR
jgi:ABA4-like protein